MKFNREPDGIICFGMCHFVFLFQILFIAYIDDEFIKLNEYNQKVTYQNPYLLLNKSIFYLLVFLAFISHVKTAITDPGIITSKNNMIVIQFYYSVHEPLIKRAKLITEKQTQEKIRKIIFDANHIQYDETATYSLDNDDDFDTNSDVDEKKFEPRSPINEQLKKAIINNYRLKLTRCRSCYVARPSNVHHCTICHCCVLEQDHHCPWVNNCVGLFNKKYFILYNFYAILSVIYSAVIFCYFSLYKHLNAFFDNGSFMLCTVIFAIIEMVYGIFTSILLFEQYDNIKRDCTLCDFNNGILLEKSTFRQQLFIIFGEYFSLKWFLPFYSGGSYNYFLKLCKEINRKEKNEDNNGPKYDKYGNKKDKLD